MADKSTQSSIEELAQVKFVGPAKARAIVKELGIKTVEELFEASKNGTLQQVKGIGEALTQKIHAAAAEVLKQQKKATTAKPAAATKPAQAAPSKADAAPKAPASQAAPPAAAPKVAAKTPAPKAEKKVAPKKPEKQTSASAPEKIPATPRKPAAPAPTDPRQVQVERFIATLRCPACGHDDFERGATTLTCTACRREYNFHSGVVDLAPPHPSGRNLSQRLMETRFYARFYEDVMRPRLTGLVADRTLGEEYVLAGELLELDENVRLLDVAAGTGNFTRHFAHELFDMENPDAERKALVVGMDLSWPMLETARTYLRRDGLDDDVFLIRGDATRIPIRRAAFNRLHCAGALHMMNNIDEALRNFARVLEPEGILVVGTFIKGDGLLRRLVKRVGEVPTKFHWFDRDDLHQRMRRAGFEIVEDSIAGDAITIKALRT